MPPIIAEDKQPTSLRFVWRMIAPMLKPLGLSIVGLVFLSICIAVLRVAEPYIYGAIIDSVSDSVTGRLGATAGFEAILPYLISWAAVVLGVTLLYALHTWLAWYLGNRLCFALTTGLFEKMLALTIHRFQETRSGAMLQRLTSAEEAIWGINSQVFRSALQSCLTFAAIVVVGTMLDWRLMLASLAVVPIIVGMGIWNMHTSSVRQEQTNAKWEEAGGLVGDAFSNISTIQSEAGEPGVFKRYSDAYAQVLKLQYRLNVQWAILDAGGGGAFVVGRLFLFFVGIRFVFDGTATLGSLIMFLGFAGALYGTVQTVMSELPMATKSLNRLSRAAKILEEIPDIRDAKDAIPAPKFVGDVEFDNVWFTYQDADKSVLRGIDVSIPAGQTFAIVGESGAGKSTLAKLLVRFSDPTKGSIRYDGIDLRDLKLSTLRPQVGFVMQENMLFHETILHNLRFAKPNATREEVVEAAKRAQAHEFILKLKDGYDTVVGERGVKLSGGQKQRIALARVLLANPPILVLDEATSALDSKTERDLQQALREVMKGRTTIVIAHRLSTVMDADNILVMDKGKVVDQGKHAELIQRDNLYKKFWEIQAGGYV